MKPVALCTVALSLVGASLHAQWLRHPSAGIPRTADGKPNLSAPAPRTSDGRPDLSGLWNTEPSSAIFFVTSGFKADDIRPWAEALYEERADNFGKDSDLVRCLPPGPRVSVAGGNGLKIVQTRDLLLLLYEHGIMYRQVFMDGRTLPVDPLPTWMGYSVGHWDRDELVIESAGFNDKSWLDLGGHPHSEALRVTERFRRLDFGHMRLDVTFDDPGAYAKPWTVGVALTLAPDTELLEDVCEDREGEHLVGRRGAEANVAAEILSKYVGAYTPQRAPGQQRFLRDQVDRSADYLITLDGGRLMIQWPGESAKIPLFALSESSFSEPGTLIEFVTNDDGAVTEMIRQGVVGFTKAVRRPSPNQK